MIYKQSVTRKNQTFLDAIADMSQLPKADVTTLIQIGGAYLKGKRHKQADTPLRPGVSVEVYYHAPIVKRDMVLDPKAIVHNGSGIVVVNKPSGMPTQGSRDRDDNCLYELLKRHLGGYVGLHHRLDQDTSGLICFTTDASLNSDVAELFSEKRVIKRYLALVRGPWPFNDHQTTVEMPIAPLREKGKPTIHVTSPQGKKAKTIITYLGEEHGLLLVEAQPVTGRTHQIRVHCQAIECPLVGDHLYGVVAAYGMKLHCGELSWPAYGKLPETSIRIPPPPIWQEQLPPSLAERCLNWGST
ncbi:MAG: RluA family pseudouridine synthase [Acidobacteria bacterium]|nr:RluA family pseudouridine synthase [Acidobacteriota bacterium]